jgi:hypothetical protein
LIVVSAPCRSSVRTIAGSRRSVVNASITASCLGHQTRSHRRRHRAACR